MKYLFYLIALVIVCVVYVACNTNRKIDEVNSTIPLLEFSKYSCRGKCQAYDLTVFSDGSILFEGHKNVENIGLYRSRLSKENLAQLQNVFAKNEFAEMEESYLSGARDLQKIRLKFEEKDLSFHKRRAPEALKEILIYLEKIISKEEWSREEND